MKQFKAPIESFKYLESQPLLESKPSPPLPRGTEGSVLAARLQDLGWTPYHEMFSFIHKSGIQANVSELYIYGEQAALQHEYTILRVDIDHDTSWLRIDWTGIIAQETSYGLSRNEGSAIWTISLDERPLVLPSDKLIRCNQTVCVSLRAVSGMIVELIQCPYELARWNCIHFAQRLREKIEEATREGNWDTNPAWTAI